MKELEISWKLIIDPDSLLYMETASNRDIDIILETIAEAIKEGIDSGGFWHDIE